MNESTAQEGYISVTGGRVWYRIVGSGDKIPMLVLHGGPGVPHDYLEPLDVLANERPVIFYDQLGCGKSDRPEDISLWNVERFVDELILVRKALGLKRMHLLGHSWGTMLATEYALRKPTGVISLILASPAISIPRTIEEMDNLVAQLPNDIQIILRQHEAVGTTDSQEYQQAAGEFYRRHLCRMQPSPEPLERAVAGIGGSVYQVMWGSSEFTCTGNLKEFDRTEQLQEIIVPTLFTCGRYDECPPAATTWYHDLTPGSEMVIFENSAHMAHLEETESYLQVIKDFLRRAEE